MGKGGVKNDFQLPETSVFQALLLLSCRFSGTGSCKQPALLIGSAFSS